MLAGGIAFDAAEDCGPAVQALARYDLAADRQAALAPPDGEPMRIRLKFDQALRGLAVNAPVEFRGINIGTVQSVHVEIDLHSHHYPVIVDARVFPLRISRDSPAEPGSETMVAAFLSRMVTQGLRAQARNGNLLTGQIYIALDFFPRVPKAIFDPTSRPLVLPTVTGGFDQLQDQMAGIVSKLNKVPFDAIGNHLDQNLIALHQTLGQMNHAVLPSTLNTLGQAQRVLKNVGSTLDPDAPLQQNLNQTLLELQRSARSLRSLTDLLDAHPEALIRGRKTDANTPENTP
jgi:paraquat-inducible protein B